MERPGSGKEHGICEELKVSRCGFSIGTEKESDIKGWGVKVDRAQIVADLVG